MAQNENLPETNNYSTKDKQSDVEEVIYISDASEIEAPEKNLYRLSSVLKYFSYAIGVIGIIGLLVGIFGNTASSSGITFFIACATIFILLIVMSSTIAVFANISMSLKDITKLLKNKS